MDVLFYSLFSVIIVSCLTLIGLITFFVNIKRLQDLLFFLVSFATGAIFGDVFFHLLPDMVNEYGFGLNISIALLAGIVVSFVIEKIIHWRHCHLEANSEHVHPFALMNLYGDGVHNFIDGLTIGASYLVSLPTGLATTMAIIFHEIPQELGDFAVLLKGGFTRRKAMLVNLLTGLVAVLGTLAALILSTYMQNITFFLVPFAAGNLLYIAGSDLIPELHKEVVLSKSILQSIALICGILTMFILLKIG